MVIPIHEILSWCSPVLFHLHTLHHVSYSTNFGIADDWFISRITVWSGGSHSDEFPLTEHACDKIRGLWQLNRHVCYISVDFFFTFRDFLFLNLWPILLFHLESHFTILLEGCFVGIHPRKTECDW